MSYSRKDRVKLKIVEEKSDFSNDLNSPIRYGVSRATLTRWNTFYGEEKIDHTIDTARLKEQSKHDDSVHAFECALQGLKPSNRESQKAATLLSLLNFLSETNLSVILAPNDIKALFNAIQEFGCSMKTIKSVGLILIFLRLMVNKNDIPLIFGPNWGQVFENMWTILCSDGESNTITESGKLNKNQTQSKNNRRFRRQMSISKNTNDDAALDEVYILLSDWLSEFDKESKTIGSIRGVMFNLLDSIVNLPQRRFGIISPGYVFCNLTGWTLCYNILKTQVAMFSDSGIYKLHVHMAIATVIHIIQAMIADPNFSTEFALQDKGEMLFMLGIVFCNISNVDEGHDPKKCIGASLQASILSIIVTLARNSSEVCELILRSKFVSSLPLSLISSLCGYSHNSEPEIKSLMGELVTACLCASTVLCSFDKESLGFDKLFFPIREGSNGENFATKLFMCWDLDSFMKQLSVRFSNVSFVEVLVLWYLSLWGEGDVCQGFTLLQGSNAANNSRLSPEDSALLAALSVLLGILSTRHECDHQICRFLPNGSRLSVLQIISQNEFTEGNIKLLGEQGFQRLLTSLQRLESSTPETPAVRVQMTPLLSTYRKAPTIVGGMGRFISTNLSPVESVGSNISSLKTLRNGDEPPSNDSNTEMDLPKDEKTLSTPCQQPRSHSLPLPSAREDSEYKKSKSVPREFPFDSPPNHVLGIECILFFATSYIFSEHPSSCCKWKQSSSCVSWPFFS
eukprot:TRINITY_DN1123_c0_g2_i6.p1 TRINITY_DN1123_c0_g2~~TRINITY_DN1123_c0_g2_i6.p1  ORF type:complete len:740 (-),score=47.20 TRINITY_DN1123_c0_g2_i6:983-3202(-)